MRFSNKMSAHYKWYPSSEEVVVPFNATYSFPSQANKSVKITPRIPPKNGATFLPGNTIRLEFPAQGYVNPANTCIEFDVTLATYATASTSVTRFQNNIQSIFTRARLLYGSTPLEDMINYNVIVRNLTEWTATNQVGIMDQCSIAEGIGGVAIGGYGDGSGAATTVAGSLVNARQAYIQGVDGTTFTGFRNVPNGTQTLNGIATCPIRRYQIQLAFGLFTQDKLLPTKFMASQLAVELTLCSEAGCIFTKIVGASGATPTYSVSNVNLIPEILEFDASYDAMFLKGLREGGVPIKFSSWHTFTFNIGGQTNANLLIQERSRSVKAIFAVQRRAPESILTDSGCGFFSSVTNSALQSYQFRIGGRYFPAAPVQCSTGIGNGITNGGAEAFLELQKALNVVGDYRLSSSVNTLRWALPLVNATVGGTAIAFQEADYSTMTQIFTNATGTPTIAVTADPGAGNVGSHCFAMAIDLETSNGLEISGLNAEEQSDISLIANWSGAQAAGYNMEVYTYYDAMIILRENNVLELIQ